MKEKKTKLLLETFNVIINCLLCIDSIYSSPPIAIMIMAECLQENDDECNQWFHEAKL